MEAYTAFAKVYDKFMDNVPYECWAECLDEIIMGLGVSRPVRQSEDVLEQERNLVLDMGCGTGILTRMLYHKGYDMIGVDISQEMLDEAYSKNTGEKECDIMYICQDMCELDLYSTVGTIISTCDSVNYLLEDNEIISCFEGVENYLYPGGLFVFDFNTIHKYRDVIGENTIAETNDECSFIWDNYYDEEADINEYDLTLFIRDDDSGMYRKETETHYQRGYSARSIAEYIKKAGLELVCMADERVVSDIQITRDIVSAVRNGGTVCDMDELEQSERIVVIARKHM